MDNEYRITEIRTHKDPSIDEWVAYFILAQNCGKFNIAHDCKLTFDTKTDVSDPYIERQFWKNGIVFLGTGGGIFDEHPYYGKRHKARVENECCATLVAKYLKVHNDPALQKILILAYYDDMGIWPDKTDKAGCLLKHFSLPRFIKSMYANKATDLEQIQSYVFHFLNETYEDQAKFHSAEPIVEQGQWEEIWRQGAEKPNSILVVHTDEAKVQDYAFSKTKTDMVLKIESTKNWQLFMSRGSTLKQFASLFAGAIRIEEAKCLGSTLDRNLVTKEGTIPGAERINYFERGALISNGTPTHEVEPSALDPLEIPKIIKKVMSLVPAPAVQPATEEENFEIIPADFDRPFEAGLPEDIIQHQTAG